MSKKGGGAWHYFDPSKRGAWETIKWQGDVATSLNAWLPTLERDGEIQLFRLLYGWKHRMDRGWGLKSEIWQRDVRERFASSSAAQRAKVLELYDLHAQLDEPTAIQLFELDADLAGPSRAQDVRGCLRVAPAPRKDRVLVDAQSSASGGASRDSLALTLARSRANTPC